MRASNGLEIEQMLKEFERRVPELAGSLQGIERVEAVHREYERVLCFTPHAFLDDAHEAMLRTMQAHGIVQARAR